EHDRARDDALATLPVLSAVASPRVARADHDAQTPAKPGAEAREPRPSPARARVKRRGPTGWWGRLNGSGGPTRTGDPVVNSYLLYRLSYAGMSASGGGAGNYSGGAVGRIVRIRALM